MADGWIKTARGWRKSYGPPRDESASRSDLCSPRFISDTMDLTEHVDGNHYDSKSAFRAVTKAKGFEEVGNDTSRLRPPDPVKRDTSKLDASLRRSIAQLDSAS